MSQRLPRVLHFIDSGGLYGAESVVLNLSARMLAAGRFVPVIGCIVTRKDEPNDLYDRARELGFEAEKILIPNLLLFLYLPFAARQLKGAGIDLIHSHGYKPSVFGWLIRLLTGIPVMATCHLWFKGEGQPLKMRVMIAMELFLYRFFRRIVAVSRPIREVLVNAGADPHKVVIIKNGVDIAPGGDLDPADRLKLRADLGVTPDQVLILNSGRLSRQKGQWNIIRAAADLKEAGRPVRFLIVGEGPLGPELEALVRQHDVADVVTLSGFRDDVEALLQAADLFILPSLDEGMPMSLLEAAGRRLPVVVTPVGDVADLITDGETGLLIPPEDVPALVQAITRLMEDPSLGRRMGEAVFKKLEQEYSSEAMYRHYAEVYGLFAG